MILQYGAFFTHLINAPCIIVGNNNSKSFVKHDNACTCHHCRHYDRYRELNVQVYGNERGGKPIN